MLVNKTKAPETMPTICQDNRTESSAVGGRESRPYDSIALQHDIAANCEVSPYEHYTSWPRLREQQQARDFWQATYGVDAERTSRGGVAWL